VSIFQTYIGSAYASHPVRWIESPEATRSRSGIDQIAEKSVEKVDPDLGKPRSASGDVLDLSPEAQKLQDQKTQDQKPQEPNRSDTKASLEEGKSDSEKSELTAESTEKESTEKLPGGVKLTPEEQQQVEELKARDQEVRVHEMAHVMAGGAHVTSGPSYEYEVGPDGNGYAVGGSVGIDTSPVAGNPEATIAKMQTVAAAALAPAKPSGQDMKVAAAARQAEAKARAELARAQFEQPEEGEEQAESEQAENENVSAFAIVKPADKAIDGKAAEASEASPQSKAESKSEAESAGMSSIRSYAASSSEFAPGSAYKAQSVMTLAAPRFSAFA